MSYLLCQKERDVQIRGVSQLLVLRELFLESRATLSHLLILQETWERDSREVPVSLQTVLAHLKNLNADLIIAIESINKLLTPFRHLELPKVQYASDEWKAWLEQRPTIPKSWLTIKIENACPYLDPLSYIPEKWRPTWSQVGAVFFSGLILGSQIERTILLGKYTPVLAKELQQKVLEAVPADKVVAIQKESAFIGTLLSDKYQVLSSSGTLTRLTQRYPQTLQTLQSVLGQFGRHAPSNVQIRNVVNAHWIQRMVNESSISNPLQHLNFQNWWTVFTSSQDVDTNSLSPRLLEGINDSENVRRF